MKILEHLLQFPKHLKIAALEATRLPNNCITTTNGSPFCIVDAKITEILAEALGFSYEILIPNDRTMGAPLPDGNWTGLIGMVQKGKADIAIGGLAPSEERSSVVDFTFPYFLTDITFTTDKPEYLPKRFAIFYPFSWQMWIVLVLLLLFMSYIFYILMHKKQNYQNVLFTTYGFLFEESVGFILNGNPLRLAMLSWFIGVLFIINFYKSLLLSSLTFPTLSGIYDINDLSRAAQKENFYCHLDTGSYISRVFMMSSDDRLKSISACLNRSRHLPSSYDKALQNSSYKKAVFSGRSYMARFQQAYLVSRDAFFPALIVIAVGKNFCCKDALDNVIHRATATGILQKYEKETDFFSTLFYKVSHPPEANLDIKLTFDDLFGAFALLIIGYLLSIIAFLIEIIYFKYSRKHKRRIYPSSK